jgi:hypothetical protein
MDSNGVPLEKVGQHLGHSNVAISDQTYARFAPDHLQYAAEFLDFTQVRQSGDIELGPENQGTLGTNDLQPCRKSQFKCGWMVGDERLELPTSSV